MDAATRRQYLLVLTAAILFALMTAAPARAVATGTAVEPPGGDAGDAMDVPRVPTASGDSAQARYPVFGVAFGCGALLSSFSDVENAFHRIEAAYAAQGIQLHPAASVRKQPVLMPTFTLEINRWVQIAWQAGRSWDDNDGLALTGGLVTGRYILPTSPTVSLFGGLGGGKYGFKFHRAYGQVISSDGLGNYTTLDNIRLEGGGAYWTAAAGVSFRPAPKIAIGGMVQYFGMGDVSTTTEQAIPISLNLSGAEIGGSLTVFF